MKLPYRLRWLPAAARGAKRLPSRIRREALITIRDLGSDPYPPQAEPLKRELTGRWKIAIDGWRIIYSVDEADRVVVIRKVAPRSASTYS